MKWIFPSIKTDGKSCEYVAIGFIAMHYTIKAADTATRCKDSGTCRPVKQTKRKQGRQDQCIGSSMISRTRDMSASVKPQDFT